LAQRQRFLKEILSPARRHFFMCARIASLRFVGALALAGALMVTRADDATKPAAAPTSTAAVVTPASAAAPAPAVAATTAPSPTATPATEQAPKIKGPVTFDKTVKPFLEEYCFECHGDGNSKGDVALDSYKTLAQVDADHKTWETVLDKLRKHEMPPDDADEQPPVADRDRIADWVENELYHFDPTNPDPGRITLHRLNRAEYNNSIRDLVGVDFQPADDFPADDSGYGFDNIGDVLSLSPMLMEKYLNAADKILDQAIATEPIPRHTYHYPANLAEIGFNAIGDRGDGWVRLISLEEDDVTVQQPILAPGDYLVRFQAFGQPTGGATVGAGNNEYLANSGDPEPPKLSIRVGDTYIKQFEVSTDEKNPGVYEARVGLTPGNARLRVVMDRDRGGDLELVMVNGKIGKQQNGIGFVKWIEVDGPLPAANQRFTAGDLAISGNSTLSSAGERELGQDGAVSVKFNVAKAGDYILRAYAYAHQAGPDPARMEFRVDGQPQQTFDVTAPARLQPLDGQKLFSLTLLHPVPHVYECPVKLTPGEKTFSAAFLNSFSDPNNDNPNLRQRDLVVQSLEVVDLSTPAVLPPMPAPIKQYFTKTPTPQNQIPYARDILTQFASRAWRRPPDSAEVGRLMGLFKLATQNGESFPGAVKLAMKAVLVSPNFLFRASVPAPAGLLAGQTAARPAVLPAHSGPENFADGIKLLLSLPEQVYSDESVTAAVAPPPKPAAPRLGVPVDEYTLATRLAYFIWSSTPDDELLNLAAHNQLRQNLPAQVHRMLASSKARALVDNFAGQWLQFRSLDTFEPDKNLFPDFTPELRNDMQTETEDFTQYIISHDRSVMDFLTADYTFVNSRLAQFYGIGNVTGDDFQKVSLAGTPRRGVLTQGSVLVLTSNPTRTSPVKRGKWVLENLLGTPPPPPPPDVPVLDEEKQLTGTLRQQMEQHRANPVCASCHARMDPIGFSLENFDAIGEWRDTDTDVNHTPIDASGTLVSGENFKGVAELVQIIAEKKRDEFLRCVSEKALTYALGRGLEYYDRPATDQVIQTLEKNDDKFSALVLGVVNSIPFQQMRRSDAFPATAPASPAPVAAPKPKEQVAAE
jgi:mono/diheme cytochrome c family protein